VYEGFERAPSSGLYVMEELRSIRFNEGMVVNIAGWWNV
jgi:hypothetical protein